MITANWGDWFIREEVERVDPSGLLIWYLGCNGFILRSAETTVYLDPYFANGTVDDGRSPRVIRMVPVPLNPVDASVCDAVLITHEHRDHFHPPSYGPLVENLEATLFAPRSAFEEPHFQGNRRAPPELRQIVTPGDTYSVGDLTIHVRDAADPDSEGPVSYVIEHESGTFFNGGDSRATDSFLDIGREFDVDIGTLAFGTSGRIYYPDSNSTRNVEWYMDENEVIRASNMLQLDRLVPCHYNFWKGVGGDPAGLRAHVDSFPYPKVIEIVEVGDCLTTEAPGKIPLQSLS